MVIEPKGFQPAALELAPITGALGAEVSNLDLSAPITDDTAQAIRDALREYKVLVFRDQMSVQPEDLLAFGSIFGEPETAEHPAWPSAPGVPGVKVLTTNSLDFPLHESWHTDGSTRERPHWVSVLQAIDVPPYGRDTLFADMEEAYRRLSPAL